MATTDPERAKLDDLIDRYCASMISQDDFEVLQSMLRERPDFRARFRKIMDVHIALHESADVGELSSILGADFDPSSFGDQESLGDGAVQGSDPQANTGMPNFTPMTVQTPSTWWHSRSAWITATAMTTSAALLVTLGVWMFNSQQHVEPQGAIAKADPPSQVATEAVTDSSISVPRNTVFDGIDDKLVMLQSSAEAVWAEPQASIRVGDMFPASLIELKSGVAELVFVSGVVAVIEGPAKLEVMSPLRGILHSGKIRCFVPSGATGFVIEAAGTRYLDLGTEFGLEVQDDGQQELHVFDGEVAVSSLTGSKASQLIGSGSGLRSMRAEERDWTPIMSDSPRFADSTRLQQRKQQQEAKRHQQWLLHIEELRQDPDLVVLYDFQRDEIHPTQLMDRSPHQDHGSIIGCQWSGGRWGEKRSLEFKRPNDRVRIAIPGEFENLTYSVWLRVDGFDREFNSIMLTRQFEEGAIHWQIRSFGAIDAGIKITPDERQIIHVSPPVLDYNDLGHWVQVTLVVDQDKGFASHFLNGELVSKKSLNRDRTGKELIRDRYRLRIAEAELGNWSPERTYDKWPIRNFNGRMDEVAIFKRAMSSEEIRKLFDAGNPYR